jgi:hypothetical protein
MTPLAERAFLEPMDRERTGFLRELMAGAQFFDCTALDPVVTARSQMPGDWKCIDEILQCELPAPHTWIEFNGTLIALSNIDRGCGDGVALVGLALAFPKLAPMKIVRFGLNESGTIFTEPFFHSTDEENRQRFRIAEASLNTAWYCIEAMQTLGGLCHEVEHKPSRQQIRSSERRDQPCHKWVEIRLGRGPKAGGGGCGAGSGATVAWHYRRGHKVDHPNPNYPKWRKGCWVGDVAAGIRTHNYVVEVPA